MKILIVNGTDLNKRASGSGVVLRQFLSLVPSEHEVTILNLGSEVNITNVKCFNIEPTKKSWLLKKMIPILTNTSLMYSKFFKDINVIKKINELHQQEHFELVYYHDTIAMQNYEYMVNVKQQAHLIDLHSSSYTYYIKSTANIFKKLYYCREYKACKAEEKNMVEQFDKLYLVNADEAKNANDLYDSEKFIGINLGVDLSSALIETTKEGDFINFIYLGNLNYKANLDGINNFIRNYFKKIVKKGGFKLHVVGPGSEKLDTTDINIFTYGYVDDLSLFMSDMDIGIATMINGSGLKNKIFDYLKFGLPVLVNSYTAKSNSIETPYIYIADNDKTLLDMISKNRNLNRKLVKDSIVKYDQRLSSQKFWSEIKEGS